MGCDIHCFVEKRGPKTGKWKKIGGFVSDYYRADNDYFSTDEFKKTSRILMCRNYDEFAVLADVRNGYGFAGCDTGDAIKPIAMPKGLPEDVSSAIKKESDRWGCDGHSHSWLTAKEIKDYDAEGTQKVHRAWVEASVYKQFKETGNPYPCCGGVSGSKVMYASNEDCEKIQAENPDKTVYTKIEWATNAKDCAKWLFTECLRQLMEKSSTGTGDDIRLVFWFDN